MGRHTKSIHQIKNSPSDTALCFKIRPSWISHQRNKFNALFTPDVEGKWKFQVSVKLSIQEKVLLCFQRELEHA